MRNEIETKRIETKRNKSKRNSPKRNEIYLVSFRFRFVSMNFISFRILQVPFYIYTSQTSVPRTRMGRIPWMARTYLKVSPIFHIFLS